MTEQTIRTGKPPILWIRADGNRQIATGHLRRTLSIAEAFMKLGGQVRYVLSDEESLTLLTSIQGDLHLLPPLVLHTIYGRIEDGLGALQSDLQKTAEEERPDLWLIDSYAATKRYLKELRNVLRPYHTAVIWLDDLKEINPEVNLAINYDPGIAEETYSRADKALLGLSYAPLRPQFEGLEYKEAEPGSILLSTGGTDPYHMIESLTRKLLKAERGGRLGGRQLQLHILVPAAAPEAVGFLQLDASMSKWADRIHLYQNVTQMAPLMQSCSLAVSAGGTTLYELCAAGVPTVSFSMSDNQTECATAIHETGVLPYAGDIRLEREIVEAKILEFLKGYCKKPERLAPAGQAMQKLIDGKGCLRIAKEMMKLVSR